MPKTTKRAVDLRPGDTIAEPEPHAGLVAEVTPVPGTRGHVWIVLEPKRPGAKPHSWVAPHRYVVHVWDLPPGDERRPPKATRSTYGEVRAGQVLHTWPYTGWKVTTVEPGSIMGIPYVALYATSPDGERRTSFGPHAPDTVVYVQELRKTAHNPAQGSVPATEES